MDERWTKGGRAVDERWTKSGRSADGLSVSGVSMQPAICNLPPCEISQSVFAELTNCDLRASDSNKQHCFVTLVVRFPQIAQDVRRNKPA